MTALTEHAEVIHQEGGNASETIQAAHKAATDPEAIKQASRKYLAMVDSKRPMDDYCPKCKEMMEEIYND